MDQNVTMNAVDEYEPPTAELVGTLASTAAGSFSNGQSDDGDFSTVKWQQG